MALAVRESRPSGHVSRIEAALLRAGTFRQNRDRAGRRHNSESWQLEASRNGTHTQCLSEEHQERNQSDYHERPPEHDHCDGLLGRHDLARSRLFILTFLVLETESFFHIVDKSVLITGENTRQSEAESFV